MFPLFSRRAAAVLSICKLINGLTPSLPPERTALWSLPPHTEQSAVLPEALMNKNTTMATFLRFASTLISPYQSHLWHTFTRCQLIQSDPLSPWLFIKRALRLLYLHESVTSCLVCCVRIRVGFICLSVTYSGELLLRHGAWQKTGAADGRLQLFVVVFPAGFICVPYCVGTGKQAH